MFFKTSGTHIDEKTDEEKYKSYHLYMKLLRCHNCDVTTKASSIRPPMALGGTEYVHCLSETLIKVQCAKASGIS